MTDTLQELHTDLRDAVRKSRLTGALCLVGCALSVSTVIVLWVMTSMSLTSSAQSATYSPGWNSFLVVVGLLLAGGAWVFLITVPRWHLRASWVLANNEAQPMMITLKAEPTRDNREVLVTLVPDADAPQRAPLELSMLWPQWDIVAFPESSADVFCDPEPGGPVVVRTIRGLLWPYPTFGLHK